jgi:hypothetical protein
MKYGIMVLIISNMTGLQANVLKNNILRKGYSFCGANRGANKKAVINFRL